MKGAYLDLRFDVIKTQWNTRKLINTLKTATTKKESNTVKFFEFWFCWVSNVFEKTVTLGVKVYFELLALCATNLDFKLLQLIRLYWKIGPNVLLLSIMLNVKKKIVALNKVFVFIVVIVYLKDFFTNMGLLFSIEI